MSNLITTTVDSILESGSELSNKTISNDFVRVSLLMLAGVLAGYTLQPVPKWINYHFDNSPIFKYIIILFIGLTAFYPLDKTKFTNVAIGSLFILIIFMILRKIDDYYKPHEKKNL
jgi:hypothetical protein